MEPRLYCKLVSKMLSVSITEILLESGHQIVAPEETALSTQLMEATSEQVGGEITLLWTFWVESQMNF